MSKSKPAPRSFRPGAAIYVDVKDEHIFGSDPCNKDNCMWTRAFVDHLVRTYGGRDYKVRSSIHGVTFEFNGRKYLGIFDSKTASRIFKYDQAFRVTRSKEKARASVRPFTTRMMIEATGAVIKRPAMSEKAKAHLRALPKKPGAQYVPKATGLCRELSL